MSSKKEPLVKDTLQPFVTIKDVMKVFSCKIDKAREIMANPDLQRVRVGRTVYVTRDSWDTFINNLVKYNGLMDLGQGFTH